MRYWKTILLLSLSLYPVAWGHHPWPERVPRPLDKAYVPIGFDDDDLVQVFATGTVNDSCAREGATEVKVDTAGKTIWLSQSNLRFPGLCLSMPLSFGQTVDIGLLPAGDYTILDAFNGAVLGKLPIVKSTSSSNSGLVPGVDDYFYALVQDAFLWREGERTDPVLVLDLRLPAHCSRLKEVKVSYSTDTIVVQPIGELVDPLKFTGEYSARRVTLTLRNGLHGKMLLHVRSQGGRALSKLVDLDSL